MAPRKKTNLRKYSEDALLQAVAEVTNGILSQRRAAEKYVVPQSTIGDQLSGRYAPAVLTAGEFHYKY